MLTHSPKVVKVTAFLVAVLIAACAPRAQREASPSPQPTPQLTFVADFDVADVSPNDAVAGERFGGISAVAYAASTGYWLGLSDARRGSRFYQLSVDYDGVSLQVHPVDVTPFLNRDGGPFAENVLDPEGLVETPWGTILISTEADTRREPVEQAKLLEFTLGGELVRVFALPAKFVVAGWPPERGTRNNRGFESLTMTPDGKRLFAGTEAALLQDGGEASFDEPALCRIVEFQVRGETLRSSAEYVYPLGPVPRPATLNDGIPGTGLVELVALSDTTLLALERDFIREREGERPGLNQSRIYVVDIAGATDVTGVPSLGNSNDWTPVRKELLLDFDDIVSELSPGSRSLDNFEAMGLGPALPDGGRSLLVVSDDNFSDTQRSAFLLFSLKVVDE